MYYNGHVCVLGRFVHILFNFIFISVSVSLSSVCLHSLLFVILVIIWATSLDEHLLFWLPVTVL